MHRRIGLLGLIAGLLALVGMLAVQTIASADVRVRVARLTGENELDPTTLQPGAGDPDGTGRARVRINDEAGKVCFKLSWSNIASPTMAHIHDGNASENGPIVVTLFDNDGNPLPATITTVKGCAEGVDMALADDIQKNPREFYVNIHNSDFPGGAIRGQLKRPK